MKTLKKRLKMVGPTGRASSSSSVLGLLTALILTSGASWASESRQSPDPAAEASASAEAWAGATATIEEGAVQVNVNTGTTPAVAEGAISVNNINEAQRDYTVKFRNNPNVYTNPPSPTIPCYKTGGVGGSGGGIGLSLGGGKVDEECVKRENIRVGYSIGMTTQARFAWCNLENNLELFDTVGSCLSADTSVVSPEYQLLLRENERIERELRETQTLIANRCAQAEEKNARLEDAWLECLEK